MKYKTGLRRCMKHECAANKGNRCDCLVDNNFYGKECPFFKTPEQVEKENEYVRKRLASIASKEQ